MTLTEQELIVRRKLTRQMRQLEQMGITAPKAPWVGVKGAFKDPRWATVKPIPWKWLEYEPLTEEEINAAKEGLFPKDNQSKYPD